MNAGIKWLLNSKVLVAYHYRIIRHMLSPHYKIVIATKLMVVRWYHIGQMQVKYYKVTSEFLHFHARIKYFKQKFTICPTVTFGCLLQLLRKNNYIQNPYWIWC
jgi:hypothetical protein